MDTDGFDPWDEDVQSPLSQGLSDMKRVQNWTWSQDGIVKENTAGVPGWDELVIHYSGGGGGSGSGYATDASGAAYPGGGGGGGQLSYPSNAHTYTFTTGYHNWSDVNEEDDVEGMVERLVNRGIITSSRAKEFLDEVSKEKPEPPKKKFRFGGF